MSTMHASPEGIACPLDALLAAAWDRELRWQPLMATKRGEHAYDDRLMDNSPEGFARRVAEDREVLEMAAGIDRATLTADERLNLDLLVDTTEARVRVGEWKPEQIGASAPMSPLHYANFIAEAHCFRSAEDKATYLERCRAFGTFLDREVEGFRVGAAEGRVGPERSVRRALGLAQRQLQEPAASWVLATPHRLAPDADFRSEVAALVETTVRPALARYASFLENDLLPVARDERHAGLGHLPGGPELYAAWLRHHTTLASSPEELMRTGMEEIARTRAEIERTAQRPLASTLAWLRGAPEWRFQSAAEILEAAQEAVERATREAPAFFSRLPRVRCEVRALPEVQAPHAPPGIYRSPTSEGGPGIYFVGTSAPETRTRWQSEEVAFHEAVPGHHLQKALALELRHLPPFRNELWVLAYAEGWALYAERLSDEMGLYSAEVHRLGMMCADLLRSARLVIDVGLHAFGWERARAEAFLRDNTPYDIGLVEAEVDRYLAVPGQVTAYKVGALEIARLRAEAATALGPQFDLRGFHGAVLHDGPVTLPVLGTRIAAFVSATLQGEGPPGGGRDHHPP
jgi:uncharacterized protein (DUF885 family)